MPHVVALYRYPVKGLTPEPCDALTVLPDGRAAGDRVLAFRFADSPAADDQWSTKHECVALVNTPALARVRLDYDHVQRRMRLLVDGRVLADEALDGPGRARLAAAVQQYVMAAGDNPLADRPERLPLRLVGDGSTPRFQDNAAGHVTLHARESIAALARHISATAIDETRFRSNIVIAGCTAWEEQGWLGRRIMVGAVAFEAAIPKARCLATHVNPSSGERDLPLMQQLMGAYPGQARPTFAIGLKAQGGGVIRVGDEVRAGN